MLIVAFHGFGSSGEESTTCKKIKKYFSGDKGVKVITPTYPSHSPTDAVKKLTEEIEQNADGGEMVFVGISLGGYFARMFANKYDAKLVLINPSLKPYETLKSRVGNNISFTKNKKGFHLSNQAVSDFKNFDVQEDKKHLPILVFLAKDDSIVDPAHAEKLYKSRARMHVYENGGHRFSNIDEALHIIDEFVHQPMGV